MGKKTTLERIAKEAGMTKCQVCGHNFYFTMIWQPFGPAEHPRLFTFRGDHFRGFPALTICENCKLDVEVNGTVEFSYKGKRFVAIGDTDRVVPIPEYVEDVLLWLEETADTPELA